MASNPYVNKVEYGGNTLIDLTSDTVDAAHLAVGYTAHDASGALIVGTMEDVSAMDTDWAYLKGNASSTNYVRWRCKNGWVTVQANYDSGASVTSSNKTFGTISSGYRPDRVVTTPGYVSSNNTACFWVRQSGEVLGSTKASSTQSTFYGTICYPID